MNITIIGNGAIGNLLAFRCVQHDLRFTVWTRQQLIPELKVTDTANVMHTIALPPATLDSLRQSDLIIVPLKAYQVNDFVIQIQAIIQPWQTLVLLHNGMGTIEPTSDLLPNVSLIAATTSNGAYKPDQKTLLIKGLGNSHLGWISRNEHTHKNAIESILNTLLAPANWHANIRLALWNKLAINAAINPLTALNKVKNGALLANAYQLTIRTLCEEISHLMQRLAFDITTEKLLENVNQVITLTAENYSSMNRDVVLKKRTEIEFINGYIAQQADKAGLHCTTNLHLLTKIRAIENTYL